MATINFFLDRRSVLKDGTSPVRIRLKNLANGSLSDAMHSIGISVAGKDWDDEKQRVKRTNPDADRYNDIIEDKYFEIRACVKMLEKDGELNNLSAADVLNRIEGKETRTRNKTAFVRLLRKYQSNCRKEKTADSFHYTEQVLTRFCGEFLQKDILKLQVLQINYSFLFDLDKWLEKKGHTVSARAHVYRNIRTIWNYAINADIVSVDKYPFRKFKIRTTRKEKEFLPIDGLKKMIALDFSDCQGRQGLEKARDFFLLSLFMCGINPIDLYNLPKQERVSFVRRKTEWHEPTPIRFAIQPEMQDIISRHEGVETMLNFCNEYKNYQSFYPFIRHRLDRIGVMIGYPQMTLYWARYSWATYAAQLDVPLNVIGKALGHADATLAEERYISFDWNKVDIACRKVIDYVMKDTMPNSVPAPKYVEKVSKKSL